MILFELSSSILGEARSQVFLVLSRAYYVTQPVTQSLGNMENQGPEGSMYPYSIYFVLKVPI